MKYKQMMHRNQFYRHNITSLHCTYSFWGLRPETSTGALSLDPAGGLPSLSLRPHALPLHPLPLHSR